MRVSTFWYCLKQGIINTCRNILFSLVSIAIISACILLFCLFFALVADVQNVTKTAQTMVGITVFFDEQMPEEQVLVAGDTIRSWGEVREVNYVSAAQAWENLKTQYFEGMEELVEGFADDNPSPGSASYEIFLSELDDQDEVVKRLDAMDSVHKVCYSSVAVAGFTSVGRIIGALSVMIIGVLLAVTVFLTSNTISVATSFRGRENEIMRYIGATNYIVCAPFVMEGVLLGALGATVPLAGMYFLYQRAVVYVNERYQMITGLFQPIALEEIFPYMAGAAGVLGIRIGFFVSFITTHRHLKV